MPRDSSRVKELLLKALPAKALYLSSTLQGCATQIPMRCSKPHSQHGVDLTGTNVKSTEDNLGWGHAIKALAADSMLYLPYPDMMRRTS